MRPRRRRRPPRRRRARARAAASTASRPSSIAIGHVDRPVRARSGPGPGSPAPSAAPRPSRARTAAPSAAMPTSPPPPQSPEMSPSGGQARRPPVGRDPRGVDPGAADHADPPAPLRAGPDRGERVVDDERVAGHARGGQGRGQASDIGRRVGAGQRVGPDVGRSVVGQPGTRPRLARRARPAVPCPAARPSLLVRGGRAADGGEQATVVGQQGDVGLGVAAVDGQDGHRRAAARAHAQFGAVGTVASSSIRTNRAPPRRAAGRASPATRRASGVGQACSRITVPSPWASVAADEVGLDRRRVAGRVPVLGGRRASRRGGSPAAVDRGLDPRIVGAGPERAAEPRPRIDARGGLDGRRRVRDVLGQSLVGQERHPGMVVRVVADEVAGVGDRAGHVRVCLGPAALDEERRGDAEAREGLQQALGAARRWRPVRMLGIEGQRDPPLRHVRCAVTCRHR